MNNRLHEKAKELGLVLSQGENKSIIVKSEATGGMGFSTTDNPLDAFILAVILPSGKIMVDEMTQACIYLTKKNPNEKNIQQRLEIFLDDVAKEMHTLDF